MQAERKTATGAVAETRSFTYSKTGKMLSATDGQGRSSYLYDSHDRISSETRATTGEVAYTVDSRYDLSANRTRVTYPLTGRVVNAGFDRANRLITSTDVATGSLTTCTYDPLGNRLTKATTGAAGTVTETATYDALNRVLTTQNVTPGRTLFAAVYGYDLVGNRVAALETHAGQAAGSLDVATNLVVYQRSYTYDAQYRLTDERTFIPLTPSKALSEHFAYDQAGNRIAHTRTNTLVAGDAGESTTATYDVLNRLLAVRPTVASGTGFTFTYDRNGNQVTKAKVSGQTTATPTVIATVTHTWDVWNRLVASSDTAQGGAIFAATYDYRTRRLATVEGPTATKFRYDGGDCFQEYAGDATTALQVEHIRGGGLGGGIGGILFSDRRSAGGTLEQFSYNPVGNTVALTDPAGGVTQTTMYGSFGTALSKKGASKNNRLANTKERSAVLGLDNHGFRYYDPDIGRYISRDPLGYPDGLNNYLYVHNNPINRIDPLGLFDCFQPAVHEMITAQAIQESMDDGHKYPGVWGSAALQQDKVLGAIVKGSHHPDAPEGLFKLKGIFDRIKDGETTDEDRKSLTYRSHMGDLQVWHSMAPPGVSDPGKIKGAIMAAAGEFYDKATSPEGTDTSRGEALGSVLHMVQDSFSPAHVERDPKTGEVIKFNDYSTQDHDEHAKGDKIDGETVARGPLYEAVKRDPNAKKAVAASADILRAFRTGDKGKFLKSVEKNYQLKDDK